MTFPNRLKSRKLWLTVAAVLTVVVRALQAGHIGPDDLGAVVVAVTGYNYAQGKVDQAQVFQTNQPQ